MIPFKEAMDLVLGSTTDFGEEKVSFNDAAGKILAEPIVADRDFPPFNRSTKDGIAINYAAIEKGTLGFLIEGISSAGSMQNHLVNTNACVEIMTGAVVPKNADTVIMYEHINIENNKAKLLKPVKKGQNVHKKGSDQPKGAVVLAAGITIGAAEIGVLASVGKTEIVVKKLPKICLVSTGNELVAVTEVPKPHQIRQSNSHTLKAALLQQHIHADIIHITDDKNTIKIALQNAVKQYDVLLLSGGVSKGKYDYLPEVFEEIGVAKVFHKVKQRPGKPFWFGSHKASKTTIFAFPGNPASTFANYHVYFKAWLNKSLGLPAIEISVILKEGFENTTDLTRFIRAKVAIDSGKLVVSLIHGNGSGDLTSLSKANGFVMFAPNSNNKVGTVVPFIPTRSML